MRLFGYNSVQAGDNLSQDAATSTLWNWNYWINCFTQDKVCVSFTLWVLSLLFLGISHSIIFYLQCQRRLRREDYVSCAIYAFLGNVCSTFGALLAKQLNIQVFTGAYMAAVDIFRFLLILFPMCGSRSRSKPGKPLRQRKKRRRRTLFVASLPFILGLNYYCWAAPVPADVSGLRRRLLTTILQDNTEIIGYALGVTAVAICWTSKVSQILWACKGNVDSSLWKWVWIFSILGNVVYSAAILCHDKHLDFILQALPWLLASLGAASMDITSLFLSCLMKNKRARQQWGVEVVMESDTISLLESPGQDEQDLLEEELMPMGSQNSDWMPLNIPQNNRYLRKMAEISHYMDMSMSIEPVQETEFGVKRSPGDGQISTERERKGDHALFAQDPPTYPPKQIIHANVSSCSSSDVTSINSELEQKYLEALNAEQWDFEDLPQDWKVTSRQQENIIARSPGRLTMSQVTVQPPGSSVFSMYPLSAISPPPATDLWFCHADTTMSEEKASAILAEYEEEVKRSGR
uniref:Transmembrane protein 44 n=1 Tax=Callorhinchus milii TaxID=7868 RepID=A0A4W3HX68_CALMI|eukprot:gi/632968581/ref/XP_007900604.1/ PREDICTED: transmembrane protein 44 isoform X1 [Callorhinchus milii]